MPGQFECDLTIFCFCFGFVRLQARFGCCHIVFVGEGGWWGDSFKMGRPRPRGWKYFGRRWTGGGGLEN